MCLIEAFLKAQKGDNESFMIIVEKFNPTISKFGRELDYDGACEDLILHLLEFIRKSNKKKIVLSGEGVAVNYIYKILLSKKNDLLRKKQRCINETYAIPEIIDTCFDRASIEDQVIVNEAISQLPKKQKAVIRMRYIHGYSDIEIASQLRLTRQMVGKIRNEGIKKLRKILN